MAYALSDSRCLTIEAAVDSSWKLSSGLAWKYLSLMGLGRRVEEKANVETYRVLRRILGLGGAFRLFLLSKAWWML